MLSRRFASPHRRQRSPRGSTIRFDESRSKFNRRGDSAPRTNEVGDKSVEKPATEESVSSTDAITKSKSLPPKGRPNREAREEEERKKQAEIEEKKKIEFEERLKRLPTPGKGTWSTQKLEELLSVHLNILMAFMIALNRS